MVSEFRELAYGKTHEESIVEKTELIDTVPRKPWPVKNIAAGFAFLLVVLWLGSYVATFIANRGQEKIAEPAKPQVQQQVQETPPLQPETQAPPTQENQVPSFDDRD